MTDNTVAGSRSLARSLALFLARRGSQRVGVVALMLRKTRFPFFFSLFLSCLTNRLLLTRIRVGYYSIGQKLEIIGRASSRLVGLDTLFYCVNLKGEDRREEESELFSRYQLK